MISNGFFFFLNAFAVLETSSFFLLGSMGEETFLRIKSHLSLGMCPGKRSAGLLAVTCKSMGFKVKGNRLESPDNLLESRPHERAPTGD